MTNQEIKNELQNLMGWSHFESKNCLSKTFEFKDFIQAFGLMAQVALFAEMKNHHPDWRNVYNKLWFELSTHDAGGITKKDIELAAFINEKAWEVR